MIYYINISFILGGSIVVIKESERLHIEAQKHIVGGVNSPSRSYKAVGGGTPITMAKAKGAYFWDVDNNYYIDYLAAYGPIIVGHANSHIAKAVQLAAETGLLYGTPTTHEVLFAKMLKQAIPSLDKVRFVNSGTEAVMTTIRVARAYTGRSKILKFAGCYHGHSDLVLVAAGSGPSTLGIPDSAGIPTSIANEVITVPYNDIDAFKETMSKWGSEIAAVLIEPIVGNFGIVMPNEGFLETINEVTHACGALVIYDEVITGFRFTYGGAQNLLGVTPDLTALGKIIGGGLPIGAYGGRADIMEQVAPLGPTYQAGTMAGNPASILAGIACLQLLSKDGTYEQLNYLGSELENGILHHAKTYNIPITVNRLIGALTIFFSNEKIVNYEQAKQTDGEMFATFFRLMLEQGIHLAPSKYEAMFISTAHTEEDIFYTLEAIEVAFKALSEQ